jgi:putative secretion ATPase (PEP-CTERM system associated)
MYDGFYNLKKKPFQLNPDPEFFFNSAIHKRAMAYMQYGLTQGEGFVVIIGTPGLGKTMLVKELVKTLNNQNIIIGVMVSSQVGATDTLRVISTIFGLPLAGDDKATLLAGIESFIRDSAEQGKRILLIVDEAQNLPTQSLEELRMISNFEMYGKIVFQTFLIGQKQLRRTIFAPEMQQLKQRIVSTFQLEPLNAEETEEYILFRLEKAGWEHKPEFDSDIFELIHQYTEGIPRRINTLCDRILLFGFLDELKVIDVASVEKVISELDDEMAPEDGEDANEASSPALSQYAGNSSIEHRVADIERKIIQLNNTLNSERALLRKALLIQLDMGEIYDEGDN